MPVQIKSAEEILIELLNNIVNEKLGDITEGSILRIIAEAIAKSEEDIYEQIQKLYDSVYIYKARGEDLDRLAALLGLKRKQGFKARGYVTFYHGELNEDKVIKEAKVSTPDGRVYVSGTENIKHFINQEQHLYRKDIEQYKLNERFGRVVEVLGLIDGKEQSVNFSFKDVKDSWIFDPTNLISIPTDSNWECTNGNLSYENNFVRLDFNAADDVKLIYRSPTPLSFDCHKNFSFFINIQDIENLRKVYIRVKSDDYNYWEWSLDKFNLKNNDYNVLDFINAKIVGIPVSNNITTIEFEFIFYIKVDNIIKLKQIFNTKAERYTGTVVILKGLDDNTHFKVSYFPHSKEVWVEGGVGRKYNVNAGEINKLLTPIPFVKWVKNFEPIMNAEDKEDDESFRERILHQQYIRGRATKAAIESAIKQLDFIQAVKVDDLFTIKVENEEHIYKDDQNEYILFNTGVVDVNKPIKVKDEDGNEYVFNTDFTIEFPNKLKWIGNTPSNNKKFYISYEYRQLGAFRLFIVPKRGLNEDDYSILNEKIDEVKAAGIQYTVQEPNYIYVDVNVKVKLKTYDNNTQNEVKRAIYYTVRDWLNNRDIGESVYRSQLIDIIMDAHPSIKYIQLNQPTDDIVVDTNEVVKAGNINIDFI